MARRLFDTGIFSVIDEASAIGVGWLLNFYTADTSTRITTYNAPSGGSANTNPVEADADGRFPEIWIEEGQTIKWVLTDELGVVKVSVDDYELPVAPPSIDPDLNDFLAGTAPLDIPNGGTGAADAVNALANLGALPAAGGTVSGSITRSGNGVVMYWKAAGQTAGAWFLTVDSDPDPTSAPGEIWAQYQ